MLVYPPADDTAMDNAKSLYIKWLAIILWVVVTTSVIAQEPQKVTGQVDPNKTVFYPEAPDPPRLQFLTSISASTDLGPPKDAPKKNLLEKFLFGEEEVKKDWIAKPYGLAVDAGKLYVCDVQKKLIEIFDLEKNSFEYLSLERRMSNPVNICIADGFKYVADPTAGKIFVFGEDNSLRTILGADLNLKPIDVVVRGQRCYVTDMNSNQVVVMDIGSGDVILRIGKAGDGLGQFVLIGDIALDQQEQVYVTDKLLGRVTVFNRDGIFQRSFGRADKSIHGFVRPKGIAVDREGRIWIVDAAPEVTKIYSPEGKLLLYFGFPGSRPGAMNMPAAVHIDYDHIDRFKEFVTPGAQIEFLVFVSNQFGEKVNVYGFGEFPVQAQAIRQQMDRGALVNEIREKSKPANVQSQSSRPKQNTKSNSATSTVSQQSQAREEERAMHAEIQRIADLYYLSMQQYRTGKLTEARGGLKTVLGSGLIPPPMMKSVEEVIQDIDKRLQAQSEQSTS